jgi:hypothetical protein
MNFSEINQNLILNLTVNEFLDSIGAVLITDIFYMYISTPVTFIGIFSSSICIFIFFHKDFNMPLYIYFRILSLTSLLHQFFGFWYSASYSIRFTPKDFQDFFIHIHYGHIFLFFHYFCFFHAGLIEIGILIDRIKIFEPRIKKIFGIEPKIMSIIFFSAALIIGIMALFIYKGVDVIWYNYEYVNSTLVLTKQSLHLFDTSDFGKTEIGKIYVKFASFMLNVPLLIIILCFNITLIVTMKRYYQNLANRLGQTQQSLQTRKKEKANKKSSIMAITLCFLTIISRTIALTAIIVFNFGSNSTSQTLLTLADFFIFLNSSSLIFVCLSFNKVFRKHLFRIIRLKNN